MFTLSWIGMVPERVRRTGLVSGGTAAWLGVVALGLALAAGGPFAREAIPLRALAMFALLAAAGFASWNTRRPAGRTGARMGVGLGALAALLMGPVAA